MWKMNVVFYPVTKLLRVSICSVNSSVIDDWYIDETIDANFKVGEW